MHESKGFTLIEALVALVILSTSFAVVWGWFGTVATNTQKMERAFRMPLLFEEFTQYLALETMQQKRQGEVTIDGYKITWQASVERSSDNELYRRQPNWIVVLFSINAYVFYEGQQVTEFNTKVVRYWPDPNAPPSDTDV